MKNTMKEFDDRMKQLWKKLDDEGRKMKHREEIKDVQDYIHDSALGLPALDRVTFGRDIARSCNIAADLLEMKFERDGVPHDHERQSGVFPNPKE